MISALEFSSVEIAGCIGGKCCVCSFVTGLARYQHSCPLPLFTSLWECVWPREAVRSFPIINLEGHYGPLNKAHPSHNICAVTACLTGIDCLHYCSCGRIYVKVLWCHPKGSDKIAIRTSMWALPTDQSWFVVSFTGGISSLSKYTQRWRTMLCLVWFKWGWVNSIRGRNKKNCR